LQSNNIFRKQQNLSEKVSQTLACFDGLFITLFQESSKIIFDEWRTPRLRHGVPLDYGIVHPMDTSSETGKVWGEIKKSFSRLLDGERFCSVLFTNHCFQMFS